jgi:hypothetical protein
VVCRLYARAAADGAEGRLVNLYRFDTCWDPWKMHAAGGALSDIVLGPGDYAINPPGVWHTADVAQAATVLFVTIGLGTERRPRQLSGD